MAPHEPVDERVRVFPAEDRAVVWFLRNRFQLVEALVDEARARPAAPDACRARLDRTVRQAQRFLVARLVVTVLLAAGAIASVASVVVATVASAGLEQGLGALDALFARVAALAGSATLALLALRLALDRVLVRYDVVAAFFAARAVG